MRYPRFLYGAGRRCALFCSSPVVAVLHTIKAVPAGWRVCTPLFSFRFVGALYSSLVRRVLRF